MRSCPCSLLDYIYTKLHNFSLRTRLSTLDPLLSRKRFIPLLPRPFPPRHLAAPPVHCLGRYSTRCKVRAGGGGDWRGR